MGAGLEAYRYSLTRALMVLVDFCFCSDPEVDEKEELTTTTKPMTRRDFRMNGFVQLPSLMLLSLGLQADLKHAGSVCLFNSFPLKTGVFDPPLKTDLHALLLGQLNG